MNVIDINRGAGCLLIVVASSLASAQCQPQWLPQPPGSAPNGAVRALGTYDGALIAGGDFTLASGAVVNRVARWTGSDWLPLGVGVNARVSAFESYTGWLIAGGEFTAAGTVPTRHIAGWDGHTWKALGPGLPGNVHDLCVHQGELIAAAGWVDRWDGAGWEPLSADLDFGVYALAVLDGQLIAAGCKLSGFECVARIARWSGAAWEPLGTVPPFNATAIGTLATHQGELFAGAHNVPVSNVYRWIDAEWSPVGSLVLWFDAESLTSFRGDLIGGGETLGFPGLWGVARWDGSAWSNLGMGANNSVYALHVHDGVLMAGGAFTTAGGLPSPYWGRWGCPCYTDCNNSTDLTVADFGCFQTQFVFGHMYADCNSDGALTVADFGCFQTRFVQGCP